MAKATGSRPIKQGTHKCEEATNGSTEIATTTTTITYKILLLKRAFAGATMKSVRKRSGTRQSSTTAVDDDMELSNPIPMRKRKRQLPRLLLPGGAERTTLFLLGIAFLLYAISCLSHYCSPFEDRAVYRTFDRVLHHDGPILIDISRDDAGVPVVSPKYIPQRPRMVGFYFDSPQSNIPIGEVETIDANKLLFRRNKTAAAANPIQADTMSNIKRQEALRNSRDYRTGRAEEFETDECKAQYQWQKRSYPTCNHLFEQDLTHLESVTPERTETVRILAHGYWRDVWKVQDGKDNRMVLKTMRYEHDFQERNYDRHRRDAVAMEQLTSSRWVMNIYGYCGNSGLFEFADGGSLDDSIFSEDEDKWSSSETLIVAYQVASGVAAVHNHPKEGIAAIAHTDITTSQFVHVGSAGVYKLNDFNRCRFIRWDTKRNASCPFHVRNNPGNFRSPEEYAYEDESEKIDVYSMGNVFYSLLTGQWPFEKLPKSSKAAHLVKHGHRPEIPDVR